MKFIIYPLLIFTFLNSCTEKRISNSKKKNTIPESSISVKIDSLFVLQNIKDLNFVENLHWDFENLYLDKSKKQKFEKLNNKDKIKFLFHVVKQEDGHEIDKEWIKMDLQAFVVAKQSKINNFTPTIIKVYGTDFTAVILVNLDDNKNIISTFPIYNIENSGPAISEDTLIVTRPKIKCHFMKNVIHLYKITGTNFLQNEKIQSFYVDSITYKASIDNNGIVRTVKIDSTRYKKNCELDYFQSY
ncbi:MAG: hypothetical protein V4622_04815 [Bacteroidota bacterium]